MTKLKPCPFCGYYSHPLCGYRKPYLETNGKSGYVECPNCGTRTVERKNEDVIEIWNSRPFESSYIEKLRHKDLRIRFLEAGFSEDDKNRLKLCEKWLKEDREKIKKLREALEKYAKGKNYIGVSSDGEPFEFEENAYGLDEMEIGFAARKALKGGEE